MHGHPLVAVIELGEQLGVAHNDETHTPQCGVATLGGTGKGVLDVGEQPRAALAAAPDGHTVAAGLLNHGERIIGTPDVAVAEHGDVKCLLELGDAGPIGMPAIIFGGGARVQGDSRTPLLLRETSGFKEGLVLVVDADANLGGDGDARRFAHPNYAADEFGEQIGFPRQGGASPATGDFGHRATEIQVHMVGHVLVHHDLRGLFDNGGIHSIQLQRADILAGSEAA